METFVEDSPDEEDSYTHGHRRHKNGSPPHDTADAVSGACELLVSHRLPQRSQRERYDLVFVAPFLLTFEFLPKWTNVARADAAHEVDNLLL